MFFLFARYMVNWFKNANDVVKGKDTQQKMWLHLIKMFTNTLHNVNIYKHDHL